MIRTFRPIPLKKIQLVQLLQGLGISDAILDKYDSERKIFYRPQKTLRYRAGVPAFSSFRISFHNGSFLQRRSSGVKLGRGRGTSKEDKINHVCHFFINLSPAEAGKPRKSTATQECE